MRLLWGWIPIKKIQDSTCANFFDKDTVWRSVSLIKR